MGSDVKTLLKDRVLNEMSIGYDPVTFDYDADTGIRHLREVKLWEVSLVTWAMNPEALVTGYKATDAANRADQMAVDVISDLKEGRKISAVRLKSLKDACVTMKGAVKALEAVVKEAEAGGDKSAPPSANPQQKRPTSTKQAPATIEIVF
jgi:hypothetical protein